MDSIEIQNSELAEVFLLKNKDPALLTQYIIKKYQLPASANSEISTWLKNSFLRKFKTKWSEAQRKRSRFFEKNTTWCSNFLTITLNEASREEKDDPDYVEGPARANRTSATETDGVVPLTAEDALEMIREMGISRTQYEGIRVAALKHNSSFFPPYPEHLIKSQGQRDAVVTRARDQN
jgi:hypothetical protein